MRNKSKQKEKRVEYDFGELIPINKAISNKLGSYRKNKHKTKGCEKKWGRMGTEIRHKDSTDHGW